MNASALLAEATQAGVSLAATERGTLKYAGDPDALERLLPAIRQHKGEILALLAANDCEPLTYATPEQIADTRRTCRQCRELASNGRCMAAARGALPLTSTRFEPFADRLERCVGYLPTADDPDQRPGKDRYPGLHARLWTMDGRAAA